MNRGSDEPGADEHVARAPERPDPDDVQHLVQHDRRESSVRRQRLDVVDVESHDADHGESTLRAQDARPGGREHPPSAIDWRHDREDHQVVDRLVDDRALDATPRHVEVEDRHINDVRHDPGVESIDGGRQRGLQFGRKRRRRDVRIVGSNSERINAAISARMATDGSDNLLCDHRVVPDARRFRTPRPSLSVDTDGGVTSPPPFDTARSTPAPLTGFP